jgi:glycosyltransferase involved in cell wall biosynthesis
VLPSFYEGVPLVLAEAAACGCRLVATALPGVVGALAPHLADRLELVPLPRLRRVDEPEPADLPDFTAALAAALARAVARSPAAAPAAADLAPFTWDAVFARVAAVWRDLLR